MNAQVFRGKTVAEAHRAARAKLGLDAVVLTTRPVRKSGIAGLFGASDIEIAAIVPEPEESPEPTLQRDVRFARGVYAMPVAEKPANELAALRAELKGDIRALRHALAKNEEMPQVASEIAELRELIEGMTEAANHTGKSDKTGAAIRNLGIEGAAATLLARAVKAAVAAAKDNKNVGAENVLRMEIGKMIPVAAFPLSGERTMIALVGPSGVGKTTTAAKLAAKARIAGKTVTLVACDTYRVGGTAQLSQYAKLMGAECVTAKTSEELRAIIDSSPSDVVIVDTSGRPPTPDGVEIAIAPQRKGAARSRSRHVLLCVPASIRANDAARVARRFGTLAPTALVVTKLDETETPAGLLHAAFASKLPVSVLCNGQRVPEDIAPATTVAVVDFIAPKTHEAAAVA
jgi:flagellar biosynthesis protein FlhF